jgi:hypothetical protein
MSVRNGFVLLFALSALSFLVACGGSSSGVATPQAPPSGGFSNANLNGTYVFSVSGIDITGTPYAIAGTLTADGSGGNGKGNITAGSVDINDGTTGQLSAPAAGVPINSGGFYSVSVDGRGQATIGLSSSISGFPNLVFDFVLQDNTHGLITEFDSTFGTGSGTIDLQASGVTPTGSYAFSLSGASGSSAWGTAGNFTLSGTSLAGLDDLNEGGVLAYTGQSLTGSLVLASSNGPATTLTTTPVGGSTTFNGLFDAFAIDSTHLKLIEMDSTATLSGDAFSQTSTTFPTGALAFTIEGETSSTPFALGGIMTATGTAVSGTEDYNLPPNISTSPVSFTAVESAGGTGRFTLGSFATFVGGTSYAAYPSSGGVLLLEIDQSGIATGAAYSQSGSATVAASQGYGLNLSGAYFGPATNDQLAEVDDIAEFTTSSSGDTISGVIDENSTSNGPATFSAPFVNNSTVTSTYTTPTNGRGQLVANVGTGSDTTLNGGFELTYYTVDGTTFPFIELDATQVSTGVFVQQSSSASSSAARPAMFVVQPLVRPHAAVKKQK